MLSIGLVHGDLSEFNVLVGSEGPVIIDLPQAVNAAGNNAAPAMLERDVNDLRGRLGRFAPELLESEFAREMWALFEQGELTADSKLTGVFARDPACGSFTASRSPATYSSASRRIPLTSSRPDSDSKPTCCRIA